MVNNNYIQAVAFENLMIKYLQRDNLGRLLFVENQRFDATIQDCLKLDSFGHEPVLGVKIAIEIKNIKSLGSKLEVILKRDICDAIKMDYDAIVFITSLPQKARSFLDRIGDKYNGDKHINIVYILKDDFEEIREADLLLKNLNKYLDYKYNLNVNAHVNISKLFTKKWAFAMGAGCSIDSKISNWDTLSVALGYEMLYEVVNSVDSSYGKNLAVERINNAIMKNYDKTSALDAIYSYYINANKESTKPKTDNGYYLALKNVLYMNYDSPKGAVTPLLTSIKDCIIRKQMPCVINYNFDSTLEQNFDPNYRSTLEEIKKSTTIQAIGGESKCEILHVHGFVPYDYDGSIKVENFVFTDEEFYKNALCEDSFANREQTNVFGKYNVIFVGVSFQDVNLKDILRQRMRKPRNNELYCILRVPKFDLDGTMNAFVTNSYKEIQESYFGKLGVKIVWVNEFSEIPKELEKF